MSETSVSEVSGTVSYSLQITNKELKHLCNSTFIQHKYNQSLFLKDEANSKMESIDLFIILF